MNEIAMEIYNPNDLPAPNERYNEILKLAHMLDAVGIENQVKRQSDGYTVTVGDLVAEERTGTVGHYSDLIQIRNIGGLDAGLAFRIITSLMNKSKEDK